MSQPTFAAVRQAVADYLAANITGLRTTPNRFAQVNTPMAVIAPQTGSLIRYATTLDGETDYSLRAILLVQEGDSAGGQDQIDKYLSPTGDQSIYAAIQKDPTLAGAVSYAAVIEATGYGLTNWQALDYLSCSLIIDIGT